jgi:hypothetical protein
MQRDVGRVGARAIVAGVTAAIVAAVLVGVGTVLALDTAHNSLDLPSAVSNVTRDVSAALRIGPALDWALWIGATLLVVAGWCRLKAATRFS